VYYVPDFRSFGESVAGYAKTDRYRILIIISGSRGTSVPYIYIYIRYTHIWPIKQEKRVV